MRKSMKQIRLFLQGFLMVNIVWFFAYILMDTKVIPNPILVYQKFPTVFTSKVIFHIYHSLFRIMMGLMYSLILGIPLGILMAYSKKANELLYPLIYFTYPIPKTALLPIAMLLLGMRDGSKILIIFLIIVFQVIVSVRDSVNQINPVMYQVVHSTGANFWQIICHVTLPAILPQLLTSIRVSLGTAISILFFVEGYGTKYGMGYYIVDAWSRIQYAEMYIGIIVISVVGFILFILVDVLSNKLCNWSAKKIS